eukprot:8762869-Alexandrium_andersonii.AAC.1
MTGTLPSVPVFAWLPTFREYLQLMPTCRASSGAVRGGHAPTSLVGGSRSGAVCGDHAPMRSAENQAPEQFVVHAPTRFRRALW